MSEILTLRQQVEQLRSSVDEPVAIVGIGCRFPGGANTPEAFWELLREGRSGVRDIDDERWSMSDYYHPDAERPGKIYSRHAGLLDRVDHFDANLFKLPAHEANLMDPQQRLLLMVCWEALRNANLNPEQLKGSKTGVFLGMSTSDYSRLAIDPRTPENIDAYACLGNAQSVAAGRISYMFGFHGPTLALDTSCSSSLLSVHLACKSLRLGESNMALAGGVNLILTPENSIGLSRMQALSRHGQCRTFDAEADGYVRGEGCGVVVLKTLAQARRDQDHIYAVIRGSAVNHDGASNGLTAPNGRMQQEVIEQALKQANLAPERIHYVEAHGTGTPLGDPIEANALKRALRQTGTASPLLIGSVKTNIGHLESAAGIAALIKLSLSLKHKLIVPHLHFSTPNPHINWADNSLEVPTRNQAWPREDGPAHAGVSAFGLSGTNVHMILSSTDEEPPSIPTAEAGSAILTFTAPSARALKSTSLRWSEFLRDSHRPFAQVCASSNLYRRGGKHRLALIAESTHQASELLARVVRGEVPAQVHQGICGAEGAGLCMLFSGQGSQYAGMGRQLYASQAAFREALDECDTLYSALTGHGLKEVLWGERAAQLDETHYTQPALFCVEYALSRLWHSLGIQPAAVMGHSLGEYAAACVAGVFSLRDGLHLIVKRGQLMHSLTASGAMLAVRGERETIERSIQAQDAQVSIAAHNGHNDLVLSGSVAAIERIEPLLAQEGLRTRRLAVSRAFHSTLMQPMLAAFADFAGQLDYRPPTLPFYSTVLGRRVQEELCDPAYWVNQVAAPVEFHSALLALLREQSTGLLEVGPSPLLVELAARSLDSEDQRPLLHALRKGSNDQHALHECLARMYVLGLLPSVPLGDTPPRRLALPVEALDEQPYWLGGGAKPAALSRQASAGQQGSPLRLRVERQWRLDPTPLSPRQPLNGHWLVISECHDVLAAIEDERLHKLPVSELDDLGRFPAGLFEGVLYVARSADDDVIGGALEHIHGFIGLSKRVCSAACLAPAARFVVAHCNPSAEARLRHSGSVGMLKTLALEYPRLRFAQAALQCSGSLADELESLLAWLAMPLDDRVPFEVRLDPAHASYCHLAPLGDEPAAAALPLRADRCYLISGGLGALGLRIAQGLASRGAGQLLLVSRSGISNAEQQAAVDALGAAGCDARVVTLDLCNRAALDTLLAECGRSLLPLAGVVHAAGVLRDARLDEAEQSAVDQVLAPKIIGAWNLHELTRHLPLDFFALFSSASAVFGNYAQGAYCAANSFVDELAALRKAEGLVATSFAWGPWADAGMASAHATHLAALHAQGVALIEPAEGLKLFFDLLARPACNPIVLDLQEHALDSLRRTGTGSMLLRLYGQAHPGTSTATETERSPLRAYIDNLHPLAPLKAIEKLLRESIAEVSGDAAKAAIASDAPLIDMGLDSLMAVQLRNRLSKITGEALPVSLLFDHPTLARLGEHLLSLLQTPAPEPANSINPTSQRTPQDIAIIGIGCRYPGGITDPDAFWKLLVEGTDAITEVGEARWNMADYFDADPDAPGKMYSRWGGLLDDVSHFDNNFFNISAQEAISMDPQQRLLLEVGWETLENAGITPASAPLGGIFVGCGPNEYSHILNAPGAPQTSAYFATGNSISVNAGRLAYFLGWEGPAIAIDTACSSSLVSVALACQSLQKGECSVALAGGVNLTLSPHTNIALSKAHMLSPDGRCKTFDQSANGYVRSEGCGLVLLKPLEQALRDGDNVLSVIKGCSINQDGRSQGLTAPNGPAQERVMRAALAEAELDPSRIQYLEAHGTGTPLGDPIEMHSIEKVYGQRDPAQPLYVGSVKSNLGHTEAAAGIASLIKLSLMLQHRTIVANLHLETLNRHFGDKVLGASPSVIVASQPRPWPGPAERATGAVSSFGFSGTNAHLILARGPETHAAVTSPEADAPCVLALSARTPESLRQLKEQYVERLHAGSIDLASLCHAAATTRTHFEVREAFVAASSAELARQLQRPWEKAPHAPGKRAANLTFLFTGQGSQYLGMGRALYERGSVFKEVLDQCAALMHEHLPEPLLQVMWAEDGQRLNDTRYTQPALFALQYALARQWMAWGIVPDQVLGHSVGEYAAACLCGVMSLEDTVRLICARARLMVERCEKGSMLVVHAGKAVTRTLVEHLDGGGLRMSLAAHNGPANTVVAGCPQALARLAEQCFAQGIDTQALKVSHGFHSPLMAPMLEAFRAVAREITFNAPDMAFISTVSGRLANDAIASADYWVEHVSAPVLFDEALASLAELDPRVCLEIGPGAQLVGMARRCLEDPAVHWLSSLKPKQDDHRHLLESLAGLYEQQLDPDWSALLRPAAPHPRPTLPCYRFQRRHFWPKQDGRHLFPSAQQQNRSAAPDLPKLGQKTRTATGEVIYQTRFAADAPFPLSDHQLYGTVVIAGATHLAMSALIAADLGLAAGYELSDITFPAAMVFASQEAKAFQYLVTPQAGQRLGLAGYSRSEGEDTPWQQHFTCTVQPRCSETQTPEPAPFSFEQLSRELPQMLDGPHFYREMAAAGYDLEGCFRWVEHVWRRPGQALSRLRAATDAESSYVIAPGLMDAFFQTTAAASYNSHFDLGGRDTLYIPFAVDAMRILKHAKGPLWCHVECLTPAPLQADDDRLETYSHRLNIYDESGEPVVTIAALRSKRAPKAVLIDSLQRQRALAYHIDWITEPVSLARPPAVATEGAPLWLILSDHDGRAEALRLRLEASGIRCLLLNERVDAVAEERLHDLLASLCAGRPIEHVLDLRSLDQPGSDEHDRMQDLAQAQRSLLLPLLATQRYCREIGCEPDWTFAVPLVASAGQAPLWSMLRGLARVMGEEYPTCRVRHVALATDTPHAAVDCLYAELAQPDDESDIRYADGVRQVARLRALPCAAVEPTLAVFHPERSYLITGGLGAIGLNLADMIVQRGGRHLLLVARTTDTTRLESRLAQWRAMGATVTVRACDITREGDVSALLDDIDRTLPPLDGVFHCAGVLRDGLIGTQSWEDFQAPLAAKVSGAWLLHKATEARPLSWFVLFSSAASVFGSPGQGNYAAANAFLDGLATQRRANGLAGLSINWGPWDGEGMASASERPANFQRAPGVALLAPARALDTLLALARTEQPNPTVVDVDWSQVQVAISQRARRSLFAELVRTSESETDYLASLQALRAECDHLAASERLACIEAFVTKMAREIMALNERQALDVNEPLQGEGLDSLMALELRNKLAQILGRKLPATLLFDYPTIRAMSAFIAEQLYPSTTADIRDTAPAPTRTAQASEDNFSNLSDDELLALLADEAI